MRVLVRTLLVLPLLAMACGPNERNGAALGEARGQIVGGYRDETTTGVVGLAIDFGGHPFVGFCSGTLIAPNLVLTAHHCVALLAGSPGGEKVICGQTTFQTVGEGSYFLVSPATDRPTTSSDPRYFRGADVRVAPGGETDVCGHDIALLILHDSIPARLAQTIIPRVDLTPSVSETFSADGYGLTEPDADMSGGTRMRLDGNSVFCTGLDCGVRTNVKDREWASDARTCPGDSGGPALDEQGRVMGVLSRGPEGCGGAVYSDVASWAQDFIIPTAIEAASIGGYEAPFWTKGTSVPPPPVVHVDAGANAEISCLGPADCLATQKCYAATGKPPGVCAFKCASSDECGAGNQCDQSVGVCVKAPAPVAAVSGDSGGCTVGHEQPSSNGLGVLATGLFVFGMRRRAKARA